MFVGDPRSLYAQALMENRSTLSGNYNLNVPVMTADWGAVVVRIPHPNVDARDLRIWPEHQTLAVLGRSLPRLPRLLYHSDRPRFQVQEFVAGTVLDDLAPRGVPVPAYVIGDVVDLMARLCRIAEDQIPAPLEGWPRSTAAFGRLLSAATSHMATTVRASAYAELYDRLGMPAAPLAALDGLWSGLTARRLVPTHCDLHRKNMIVREGRTYFLDWELCLLHGDPVHDLAIHLTKMGYRADEEEALRRRWAAALPADCSAGWSRDLPVYQAHEHVKAAIVESVRYTKRIAAGGLSAADRAATITSMTRKLNAAHEVWATRTRLRNEDVEEAVTAVLASPPPSIAAWTPVSRRASGPRRPATGGGRSP